MLASGPGGDEAISNWKYYAGKSQKDCHYAMKRPCWQVKVCAIRHVFSDAISESWQETAIPDDQERQKKVEADAATQQVCTTATKLVSIFRLFFSIWLLEIVGV